MGTGRKADEMPVSERVASLIEDLRCHRPELHGVAMALRSLIFEVAPNVGEEVKYGGLLYSLGQAFCGIFVYRTHVTLEFGQGARLADPHGELLGQGKYRRHIKFSAVDEIAQRQARFYLAQALDALGGTDVR